MGAEVRVARLGKLPDQLLHLLDGKAIASLDSKATGIGNRHLIPVNHKSTGDRLVRKLIYHIPEDGLVVPRPYQRRRRANDEGVPSERRYVPSHREEVGAAVRKQRSLGSAQRDGERNHERLDRYSPLVASIGEPFIEDALMRNVLINEDRAVDRLRHDVGVGDLAQHPIASELLCQTELIGVCRSGLGLRAGRPCLISYRWRRESSNCARDACRTRR